MDLEHSLGNFDEGPELLSREHYALLRRMWVATRSGDLPVRPPLRREEASQISLSLLHNRLSPDEVLRDWVRATGARLACAPDGAELSYNLRRTLRLLLSGDSEEEIAQEMRVTCQVVQAMASALYSKFGVKSRSELMALWIWPGFQTERGSR